MFSRVVCEYGLPKAAGSFQINLAQRCVHDYWVVLGIKEGSGAAVMLVEEADVDQEHRVPAKEVQTFNVVASGTPHAHEGYIGSYEDDFGKRLHVYGPRRGDRARGGKTT